MDTRGLEWEGKIRIHLLETDILLGWLEVPMPMLIWETEVFTPKVEELGVLKWISAKNCN